MQPVLRKNILQYYCSLRFYNKIAITIKKSNNYYCNIVQYIDNILQYFELVQSRYNKQEIDDKYIVKEKRQQTANMRYQNLQRRSVFVETFLIIKVVRNI